ncbi:MAG TPA: dephospho-CoA kinase, partial [Leptospiraceae bacterium]|nr:dephospho-CoA kinase [Leptospiraceae bacterium]
LTVVISTPDEIRHDRLKKRGLTEEDIKRREGLQLKPAEKENRADVVLTNAGAPEDLENAILKILESSRRALK